jgi:L-fuconolactonase
LLYKTLGKTQMSVSVIGFGASPLGNVFGEVRPEQGRAARCMRVDAHHHLWSYDPTEYDWIDGSMAMLRRDFLSADLEREAAAAGVSATVAVQARQTLDETDWLLGIAADHELIAGVVGWAPIASPQFEKELERLSQRPLLKGLRHVVQAEPAGFLDQPAFNAGIAAMEPTSLVYELLIFAHQLQEAARFVDRHPKQQFVLDHIAKPAIAKGEFAVWSAGIGELAKRQNVVCKVSGMVTEADWAEWTSDSLKPYFDCVLEAFGPKRLMIGTDWPVINVACSYLQWWKVIEDWLRPLSAHQRSLIEGEVAAAIYGLDCEQGKKEKL